MVLSLLVTATGTARFAVAIGYDATVGYAVGGVFDLAKGCLLVTVFALWVRRSFGDNRRGAASSSSAGLRRMPP
jgi:hypothetical protein